MLRRPVYFRLFCAAGLVSALLAQVSCADVAHETNAYSEPVSQEGPVRVTPQFIIEGTDALPADLYLAELGLSISEIRLEPMSARADALAYVTSRPLHLTFDVARGEVVKSGEEVAFPAPGRYLVSLRLEPSDARQGLDDEAAREVVPSVSMSGFVAGDAVRRTQPAEGGEGFDGNPLPLPFEPGTGEGADGNGLPEGEWAPFRYESRRAVFYTFSDVELVRGEQVLAFTFNLNDWAEELVEPIARAVGESPRTGQRPQGGVDVTSELDSAGDVAGSLMDTARVKAVRTNAPAEPGR